MSSESVDRLTDKRLPELGILRRIDRAMTSRGGVALDDAVEMAVVSTADLLGTNVSLHDPRGGHAFWSAPGEPQEGGDSAKILLGINGESLQMRWQDPKEGVLATWVRSNVPPVSASYISPKDFLHTLATQFESLFEQVISRHANAWLDALEADFFEADLQPAPCMQVLADSFNEIFPPSRLFTNVKPDLVQVLFIEDKDDSLLRIVASTGPELGTLVRVHDSAVGLVIPSESGDSLPFLLGDPSAELYNVYKGFATQMRTELVLPLRDRQHRTFGAVNIETSVLEAFTLRDVAYLRSLLPRLSLLINALRMQMLSDKHARFGIASAQSHYWSSIGRILRHDLRNPLSTISMALQEIRRSASSAGHEPGVSNGLALEVEDLAEKALVKVHLQERLLEEFRDSFRDYLKFEPVSISDACRRVIRLAYERLGDVLPDTSIGIILDIPADLREVTVYASPLLDVFLYNVLENSIYWLDRNHAARLAGEVRVSVSVIKSRGPESLSDINQLIELVVEDNGPGASPEIVRRLNDPSPRTVSDRPDGDGYALQALKDYAGYIGGTASFESEYGSGFTVRLRLRRMPHASERKGS